MGIITAIPTRLNNRQIAKDVYAAIDLFETDISAGEKALNRVLARLSPAQREEVAQAIIEIAAEMRGQS